MNLNEKEQSTAIDKNYVISTWEDGNLNLDAKLLRGIYAYGFEKPSQIQCQSLYPLTVRPPLDIIAQPQSGTGKTGAFVTGIYKLLVNMDILLNLNLRKHVLLYWLQLMN